MGHALRFTEDDYAALTKRRQAPAPPSTKPVKARPRRGDQALPVPLERDVLADVLAALQMHPRVAWAHRFNTGAMEVDGRYIRFAFVGCSDVLGQLTTGELLAIECKREGKDPTPAQAAFLLNVASNGGCAFVARGVDDVWKGIA